MKTITIQVQVPDDFDNHTLCIATEIEGVTHFLGWQQVSGEPCAVVNEVDNNGPYAYVLTNQILHVGQMLFAAPQQREPLSDAEIESLGGKWVRDGYDVQALVRAIEAAHNIGVKS